MSAEAVTHQELTLGDIEKQIESFVRGQTKTQEALRSQALALVDSLQQLFGQEFSKYSQLGLGSTDNQRGWKTTLFREELLKTKARVDRVELLAEQDNLVLRITDSEFSPYKKHSFST